MTLCNQTYRPVSEYDGHQENDDDNEDNENGGTNGEPGGEPTGEASTLPDNTPKKTGSSEPTNGGSPPPPGPPSSSGADADKPGQATFLFIWILVIVLLVLAAGYGWVSKLVSRIRDKISVSNINAVTSAELTEEILESNTPAMFTNGNGTTNNGFKTSARLGMRDSRICDAYFPPMSTQTIGGQSSVANSTLAPLQTLVASNTTTTTTTIANTTVSLVPASMMTDVANTTTAFTSALSSNDIRTIIQNAHINNTTIEHNIIVSSASAISVTIDCAVDFLAAFTLAISPLLAIHVIRFLKPATSADTHTDYSEALTPLKTTRRDTTDESDEEYEEVISPLVKLVDLQTEQFKSVILFCLLRYGRQLDEISPSTDYVFKRLTTCSYLDILVSSYPNEDESQATNAVAAIQAVATEHVKSIIMFCLRRYGPHHCKTAVGVISPSSEYVFKTLTTSSRLGVLLPKHRSLENIRGVFSQTMIVKPRDVRCPLSQVSGHPREGVQFQLTWSTG